MARKILRSVLGFESRVIFIVVASAVAIGVFVQATVTQIREALPAEVLEQQQDISSMLHILSELVRTADLMRHTSHPDLTHHTSTTLAEAMTKLQNVRQAYNFAFLHGASAMHAIADPALQDIQRWLTKGASGYAPDAVAIKELVYLRARVAYRQMRTLQDTTNRDAAALLMAEAGRLEQFRDSLKWYLAAFALAVLGVVVLFVLQRNTQARIAHTQRRLAESVEWLNEGFTLYDDQDRLVLCNRYYRELFQQTTATPLVTGTAFAEIAQAFYDKGLITALGEQRERLLEERLARHRSPGEPFDIQLHNGTYLRVSERKMPDGWSVSIYTDLTDIRQAQERLEHIATHDTLTGLLRRGSFEEHFQHALAVGRRYGQQVAVLFFDLDHFKRLNDTLGHAAGDELLAAVGQSLMQSLRESDTMGRLGGDEFVAFLERVSHREEVQVCVERAMGALATTLQAESGGVQVTASIGIAMFPQDGENLVTLLKNADAACYQAKARGRNTYQFYADITPSVQSQGCF